MRNHTTPVDCTADLFHPVEHAILADYLQVARPACAQDINLDNEVEREWDEGTHDGIIRIRPGLGGSLKYYALESAVARLVLNGIEKRLPQWAAVYEDGRILFGRKHNHKWAGQITLLPVFLLEINWADSGPGFSWPEQYHATYVPGYHQYVITASHDSPDSFGYEDIAIGHFAANTPLEAGCRQVIIDWWRQRDSDPELRWQDFWQAGLFNLPETSEWADEVWGEDTSEEFELPNDFPENTL